MMYEAKKSGLDPKIVSLNLTPTGEEVEKYISKLYPAYAGMVRRALRENLEAFLAPVSLKMES